MKHLSIIFYLMFFFLNQVHSQQVFTKSQIDTLMFEVAGNLLAVDSSMRELSGGHVSNKYFNYFSDQKHLSITNSDTSTRKVEVNFYFNDPVLIEVVFRTKDFFAKKQSSFSSEGGFVVLKDTIHGEMFKTDSLIHFLARINTLKIYQDWLSVFYSKSYKKDVPNGSDVIENRFFESKKITPNVQAMTTIQIQKRKDGSQVIVFLKEWMNRAVEKELTIEVHFIFLGPRESILEAKYAVEKNVKAKDVPSIEEKYSSRTSLPKDEIDLAVLLQILLNPTLYKEN